MEQSRKQKAGIAIFEKKSLLGIVVTKSLSFNSAAKIIQIWELQKENIPKSI